MKGRAQRKMSVAPMTEPMVAPAMAPADIDVERGTSIVREDSRAAIFALADTDGTRICR